MLRYHKSAPIMALVGLYLVSRGFVFWGIVVAVIGVAKLVRWRRDPRHDLHSAIVSDARRFSCRIPRDEPTWYGLENVYLKFHRTRDAYPALAEVYTELVDAMWQELRMATATSEWRRVLRIVAQDWPAPYKTGESPVTTSLRNAERASRQWREARSEAFSAR